eukprot:Rmarinus@m.21986
MFDEEGVVGDSLQAHADLSRAPTALILTLIAGASTGLGGFIVVWLDVTRRHIGEMQAAAAGVMLFMSLVDLVPAAVAAIGPESTAVWFVGGGLVLFFIMWFVPEPEFDLERGKKRKSKKAVLMTTVITAVGLTLHNFPEGIAVFLTTLQGTRAGAPLALAVALHNIPEGAVVSLPILYSTGSWGRAIGLALLTGMAEPLGMLVVWLFFSNNLPSDASLQCMLSAVAGVMFFLSVFNLVPMARAFVSDIQSVAIPLLAGFIFMGITTYLVDSMFEVKELPLTPST